MTENKNVVLVRITGCSTVSKTTNLKGMPFSIEHLKELRAWKKIYKYDNRICPFSGSIHHYKKCYKTCRVVFPYLPEDMCPCRIYVHADVNRVVDRILKIRRIEPVTIIVWKYIKIIIKRFFLCK